MKVTRVRAKGSGTTRGGVTGSVEGKDAIGRISACKSGCFSSPVRAERKFFGRAASIERRTSCPPTQGGSMRRDRHSFGRRARRVVGSTIAIGLLAACGVLVSVGL